MNAMQMTTHTPPIAQAREVHAVKAGALRRPGTWLALAAAALLVASFYQPFWGLRFLAPQYPGGLSVTVYLSRVTGDVEELNGLNHYIGMADLGAAAAAERSVAPFLVAGLAGLALLTPFVGSRTRIVSVLPVLGFPLGVLADLYYWMRRYGHTLDPAAPIRLDPFTPVMLGWGKVAQFKTYGWLGGGFYLALAAAALLVLALWLSRRTAKAGGAGTR